MPINAALRRQLTRQGAAFDNSDIPEILNMVFGNTEDNFSLADATFSQVLDLAFQQTMYADTAPHRELIGHFKGVIGTMQATDVSEITKDNPKVLRIRASSTAPIPEERTKRRDAQRAERRDVYNLFYRYGAGIDNDEAVGAVDEHGETFIGLVTLVFEAFPDSDLLETSAIYHDAMLRIADQLRLTPDWETSDFDERHAFGISDVRLGVQTVGSAAGSIERLEFQIEIDWHYPI